MNILYVVDADIGDPSSGNAQRSRLVHDALCKIGRVYVLDTRKLKLLPRTGIKGVVNAIWQRTVLRVCGQCLVPVNPFPLQWSIDEFFPGVKFDVVVSRYLYNVGRLTLWNVSRRLYVDIDDHPIQVFDTVYASRYGFLRRMASRSINGMLCRHVIGKLAGCWIANPDQVRLVNSRRPCVPLRNIPFSAVRSAEANQQNVVRDCNGYVFTVGLMEYAPNYLGIDSFLNEIWPLVHLKYPDLRYKIAGKDLPTQYHDKWLGLPNVDVLGFVDDVAALYANCLASVVPISKGGGTCIKTLESMAHSRICISTPFGARGLPEDVLSDGAKGVVIYRSAEEFVAAIDAILDNQDWRRKCEMAASEYIREHCSREKFAKVVVDLICDGA